MQNIEVEKQIESFQKRVDFLKEWRDSLTEPTFENRDKVYRLETEIESKEALIAMRKKDLERVAQEKEKEVNEVKANYAMLVNKIKEAVNEIKEEQAKALINGIITRSTNPELSIEEMVKDYKIMKSIVAIIPKEKPVETTELKVSEK